MTRWLGRAGAAETAARVSQAALDLIAAQGDSPLDLSKTAAASAAGTINVAAQATAGALSTAADVEIENAELYEEVQNLLLDQSELLIDALVAEQAVRAKYVEFVGISGHMDDVINETQRQRAYLKLSPATIPAIASSVIPNGWNWPNNWSTPPVSPIWRPAAANMSTPPVSRPATSASLTSIALVLPVI